MADDEKLSEWVLSSKKRTAVMKAMEGYMSFKEIVDKAKEYDNSITQEEVEAILGEFEKKGLVG